MLPPGNHPNEANTKALFAAQNFPINEASFGTVLRQPDAMQLITCHVSGCGCREGYLNNDLRRGVWECKLHSAISLSSQIIKTLSKHVAASVKVDVKVDVKVNMVPPKPLSGATKGVFCV
jgi:hypothetical protein